jgi:hypothetical protein
VIPTTHQHDSLPSNSRSEIAKSVPTKISSEPTAPIEISANSAAACSGGPDNNARFRSLAIAICRPP